MEMVGAKNSKRVEGAARQKVSEEMGRGPKGNSKGNVEENIYDDKKGNEEGGKESDDKSDETKKEHMSSGRKFFVGSVFLG